MTNGPVEGINNKLRVIARRAYGFHSPGALISMLFLCCGRHRNWRRRYPHAFEETHKKWQSSAGHGREDRRISEITG